MEVVSVATGFEMSIAAAVEMQISPGIHVCVRIRPKEQRDDDKDASDN